VLNRSLTLFCATDDTFFARHNWPDMLRVVDPVDDTYRRQMNRQLTMQESRHKLARDICHGKRGQIMQAYRAGQEDQLGLRPLRDPDAVDEEDTED
jgi:hypothetical protein